MKLFVTEITAISPLTGKLIRYCGPNVPGISVETAQEYCENNGLGYCKVIGKLVAEVECKKDTYRPDWNTFIDYEKETLN